MINFSRRIVGLGSPIDCSIVSKKYGCSAISNLAFPFLLFAILLTAGRAEAGPKHWIQHHKRFLLMEGAAIGAASIHAYGLHHCRRANGVEPCDSHYGEAWAAFGVVTGMTVVAMPIVAESCWRGGEGHFCDIFAYSGSAAQAGWGIHELTIRSKREKADFLLPHSH